MNRVVIQNDQVQGVERKAAHRHPVVAALAHFPVLRNSRAIAKFHNTEIVHFGHNAFIHELIRGSLIPVCRSANLCQLYFEIVYLFVQKN